VNHLQIIVFILADESVRLGPAALLNWHPVILLMLNSIMVGPLLKVKEVRLI
jgi:hypothetical protein